MCILKNFESLTKKNLFFLILKFLVEMPKIQNLCATQRNVRQKVGNIVAELLIKSVPFPVNYVKTVGEPSHIKGPHYCRIVY